MQPSTSANGDTLSLFFSLRGFGHLSKIAQTYCCVFFLGHFVWLKKALFMTELNYFFGHLKKIKSMTEKSPKNSNELSAWEHQM